MAKAKTEEMGPLPAPTFEGLVAVEAIDPSPHTSRVVADEGAMEELVESMRRDGLLYPIKVRPIDGRYQVVCGHRRLEAARRLAWEQVAVQVVEVDDGDALRVALTENLKRASLHPLEEALQFQTALETLGWTQKRLAEAVGRSRSYISERLLLLQLSDELQVALRERAVTPAQAVILEPLKQLGLVPDGLRSIAAATGEVTDESVGRMVEQAFEQRTVRLDDQTPFAWKEICAEKGCLGTAPDGRPVCTSPTNYVASVVDVHREEMVEKVAEYVAGPGKKQGVDDTFPVFYDLHGLQPGYRVEVGEVEGFPSLPVSMSRGSYDDKGEALKWDDHISQVADKDGCRACPAWCGKGPGRALLVTPPARYMYGGERRVTILCMNAKCRKKKQREGRSAQDVKDQTRKQQIEEAQGELGLSARAAMDRLAGDRLLLLAALLVRRDGVKQEAHLEYNVDEVLRELAINLPPFGGTSDSVIHALKALGEEALLHVHALMIVRNLDRAYETYDRRWMPNRLAGTLELLFGPTLAEQLQASVEAAKGKKGKSRRKGATSQ